MNRGMTRASAPLSLFHPAVREWFSGVFEAPTRPQRLGWPAIARGESTLILAPTGSGKTLAAFLWCLNRLMFEPVPAAQAALPRALRLAAQGAGGGRRAQPAGAARRHRQRRDGGRRRRSRRRRSPSAPATRRPTSARGSCATPADILITTPESLFLLLTSRARERLAAVDTVIIDEIHALVPGKRGAHLALSLERLEALRASGGGHRPPLQRIGLSATQRPLDEVARFLGGADRSRRRRRPRARHDQDAGGGRQPRDEVEAESARRVRATQQAARAFRPVTVVDASDKKPLKLRVEVPVEDMARLGRPVAVPSGPAVAAPGARRRSGRRSIRGCWS